jgi:hypothetical protein
MYLCIPDKEVEGYYDEGLMVEDYITLLWTDDKCVVSRSLLLDPADLS